MNRHAPPGLPWGCPYPAVGIQRALESAIGLPRRSTSVSWMLGFLMPAEVRRSFMTAFRWSEPNAIRRLAGRQILDVKPTHYPSARCRQTEEIWRDEHRHH